jgi:hypothetical protein
MLKKIFTSIRLLFSHITTSDSGTEYIAYARAKLTEQNKLHAASWQLGKEQGWTANIRQGVVVFTFAKGVTGTANFQVIGTYDEIDGTFLWGWAHSFIPLAMQEHAHLAKQWGLDNQHPSYTSKSIACSLDEGWNFAAVTNSLASSKGVYRGHAGTKYIFMTLGEMEVQTEAPSQPHWAAIVKA